MISAQAGGVVAGVEMFAEGEDVGPEKVVFAEFVGANGAAGGGEGASQKT